MTYRPGRLKRVVDVELPHPRDSEVVSSDAFGHCVAQIWQDLREEASRGIQDERVARAARGSPAVILPAWARSRAARAAVRRRLDRGRCRAGRSADPGRRHQSLHRAAARRRSSPRCRASSAEENVLHRFWQTTQEVLWASLLLAVVGIALGALLYRFRILRLACETWVGALAAAPIVLLIRCSWCCSGAARRRSWRSASPRVSRR